MLAVTDRALKNAIPLVPLSPSGLLGWLTAQPKRVRTWVDGNGFRGKAGQILSVPGPKGVLDVVLVGTSEEPDLWSLGDLPYRLPEGGYELQMPAAGTPELATSLGLGWSLGAYRFDRYKKIDRKPARLQLPKEADLAAIRRTAEATFLVRDLINTPAEDMGPASLAAAAKDLAKKHKAKISVTIGDELLEQNFPAIHRVGRAAAEAPRLIDLRWGKAKDPKVTLVGKGVCFDTGGLDLKPSSAMLDMKKDMGGSAHVLGLAHMIMAAKLPVCLRVLVPAVENAVSSASFRPRDIITMRNGTTVEVGNTDAEGRLVLADALSEAVSEDPDLIVDFATLTGAARVALGTDLPAFFANDDETALLLSEAGDDVDDPLWRMPLWQPYRRSLETPIADLSSTGGDRYGGAITAALFLEHFVGVDGPPWVHIDLMAYMRSSSPGRPVGGEAMGMRAVYEMIRRRSAG